MHKFYSHHFQHNFIEQNHPGFWGWGGWNAVSVIVLGFTLYYAFRSTRAAEKITEHQMMPAVDVNMIYDKKEKQTYFWFSNASNIPALVTLKLKTKTKEYPIPALRISPNNPGFNQLKRTASHYDFLEGNESDGEEAELYITAASALDGNDLKYFYKKSYRFNKNLSRWDESTWGFPDLPFSLEE